MRCVAPTRRGSRVPRRPGPGDHHGFGRQRRRGIATYSIAGAHFGYSLLWTLVPITAALIVVQEMVARMGVVTGKTLADLIREKFGVRPTFFLLARSFSRTSNTVAEFAGWAAALEIFGVSKYISVPIGAAAVWFLVVKGTYRVVEKIFLIASTLYFTYALSAYFAHPQWGTVARSGDARSAADSAYVIMLIGWSARRSPRGCSSTCSPRSWRNISRWRTTPLPGGRGHRLLRHRHRGAFDHRRVRGDDVRRGVHINDAKDAALALAPLAGKYASFLFAVGLANASLFSASILPLATAYSVCEGMGWESGIDKDFRTAPIFSGCTRGSSCWARCSSCTPPRH